MDTNLPTANESAPQDPRFTAAMEAAARVNEPAPVNGHAPAAAESAVAGEVPLELNELVNAEFVVDVFDGLQQSGVHLAAWLSKLELTERHRALIPLDDGERTMIRPWAKYAAAKLQQEMAEDPKVGVQVCLASLALVVGKRVVLLYSLFREERAAREAEAQRRLQANQQPPQVS